MKIPRTRLLPALIVSICVSILASGCNTAKGFGEDLEELGEAIQGK